MTTNYPYPLCLGSRSEARARMLRDLGYDFSCVDPQVDEAAVKAGLKDNGANGAQVAETLAELKAQKISLIRPGHLVIAADQVLECNDVLFDKPADMDQAKAHLMALCGKSHTLETSVCLVLDGQRLWHHNEQAHIRLRERSEVQIEKYLMYVGSSILNGVGCYRIESDGSYLIAKITGDPYVIQGIPMISLLHQLEILGFESF